MSVGQSQGGLPPDAVVEKEADILKESQRLIEDYHDASHGSMPHRSRHARRSRSAAT
jgi:hypothetical protein